MRSRASKRARTGTRLKGRQRGGPPAHREATKAALKRAEILARQERSWSLWVGGATLRQAGDLLKVSDYTVWHDVRAHLDGLRERSLAQGEAATARQLARLDALVRSHYPKRAERASAEIILAAAAHEAKLLDLYPRRETGYTTEDMVGVIKGMTALFLEVVADAEQRRAFAAGIRRLVAGQAIEGSVVPDGGGQ